MSRRAMALVLLAAAAPYAGAVLAQTRIDAGRAEIPKEELLYLPNEKLLTHLTGGMSSVVADLLWLRCIQYTAEQAKGEQSFEWLNQMLNTTVRLDPYFTDVYRYGGMFLAALKADDDAGLALLHQGMVRRPEAWELPYEAAMIHLLNRGDEPGAKRAAAVYLSLSAATGNAPERVRNLAAKLQEDHDLIEIEYEMWRELLESEDKALQELAGRKLLEVEIRQAVKILNERLAQYREATGQAPLSLEALGLPAEQQRDKLGGRFFLADDGQVHSTTILEGKKSQRQGILQTAVRRYHDDQGAYPSGLDALVQAGYLTQIPENPWPGQTWRYDQNTGQVE